MKLRADIFVVEQKCSYYDLDNIDIISTHIFYKKNNKIITYARATNKNIYFNTPSFCRICVHKKYRNKKLGTQIVKETMKYMFDVMSVNAITIEAQEHARNFYANFGFKEISDVYEEYNIKHIHMKLTKEDYLLSK